MKKLLVILLALVMCLSLVACGKAKTEPEAEPTQSGQTETKPETTPSAYKAGDYTKALAAKLEKLVDGPFRMGMKTKMDVGGGVESDVDMFIYMQGEEKMAAEINAQGQTLRVVYKDGDGYLVMDSEKMAMKTGAVDIEEAAGSVDDVTESAAAQTFTSGKEDIDGKEYVWEQAEGEDAKIYFEPDTGVWKYVRSGDTLAEITAYDDKVDASVFEIPSDYEIIDASSFAAA